MPFSWYHLAINLINLMKMSEDKAQNTFHGPEKCGEKVRKVL